MDNLQTIPSKKRLTSEQMEEPLASLHLPYHGARRFILASKPDRAAISMSATVNTTRRSLF